MSEASIKNDIEELFNQLNTKANKIVHYSSDLKAASKEIKDYVASVISSRSKGYIIDLYADLSIETLNEPVFGSSVKNSSKFYDYDLQQKMMENFAFNITKTPAFDTEIQYKKVAAGRKSVGCGAVAGIIVWVLLSLFDVPVGYVIVGTPVAAIGTGVAVYYKVVPEMNKQRFSNSVNMWLQDLKKAFLEWVDRLIEYYDQEVDALKATL